MTDYECKANRFLWQTGLIFGLIEVIAVVVDLAGGAWQLAVATVFLNGIIVGFVWHHLKAAPISPSGTHSAAQGCRRG